MARIRLSRSAFFHNLDIIAQETGSVDKIALVLKDNAYGHGLQEIVRLSIAYGISRAVVRTESEAAALGGAFPYVLVLSDLPKAPVEGARYTLNSLEQIERCPRGCPVELKVDTGMHRNGIDPSELEAAFAAAKEAGLKLEGVFTHYRSADALSSELFWQRNSFAAVKSRCKALAGRYGFENLRFHSANSAALFRGDYGDEAMVRVGIAAYGCLQLEKTLPSPALRPVLSLWANRIASRRLEAGERVGYNGTFEADEAMRISSYDVGYADGLLRAASGSYTTPGGYPLLGRISMDNCSFGCTEEELLLFEDANAYAASAGTIGYEVLVGLRSHLPREVVD